MAAAEGRTSNTASCAGQDFKIPPNSSVSKNLESDLSPNNSVDHIHANSGGTPHNPNFDRSSDMKRWPHVKNNLGGKANYGCQHLNSFEPELSTVYAGFIGDNVKVGGDQSISDLDVLSYIESANIAVEQQWYVLPTCLKNNNNTRMPKTEVSLNSDMHFISKKKGQGELRFSDGQLLDRDIASFMVYEDCKITSDLESHLMGAEKTGPWWRNARKDELASLVAQKSLEQIENCDLPQPQTKHFRQKSLNTKGVDHGKTPPSPLNQKAKIDSFNVNSCTSETPTSSCSFWDLNMHFSSSQSKDSGSSNKDSQINSDNGSMSELLEALCHSQTRAREAEKAAQEAYNEKEHGVSLFIRQASQLFAYKQWFHMLQLENLCLQLRNKNQPLLNLIPAALPLQLKNNSHGRAGKRKTCRNKKFGIGKCAVAFAVGLGLAGAGLILGWTMGWMFP